MVKEYFAWEGEFKHVGKAFNQGKIFKWEVIGTVNESTLRFCYQHLNLWTLSHEVLKRLQEHRGMTVFQDENFVCGLKWSLFWPAK